MDVEREKTLEAHFASDSPLRPIMTSLNGDNSWLLSFPRPRPERASTGKAYYHVVFEPWLNGPSSQFSSWLIHLRQAQAPAVGDAEAVGAVARQIEAAAATVAGTTKQKASGDGLHRLDIDAIFLGFHYLDHTWNHFTTILGISSLDASVKSWRSESRHPGEPFPAWLRPIRLPGHHELNYVTALVWTHVAEDGTERHEAIFQTPHGTKLDTGPLQAFLDSEPQTEKVALLHGLKEGRAAGSMNTYGAAGGLALYRRIGGAKYWVLTHHSEVWYAGLVMRLLWVYDTPRTVQWALDKEAQDSSMDLAPKGGTPNVVKVDNGGSFVLA